MDVAQIGRFGDGFVTFIFSNSLKVMVSSPPLKGNIYKYMHRYIYIYTVYIYMYIYICIIYVYIANPSNPVGWKMLFMSFFEDVKLLNRAPFY